MKKITTRTQTVYIFSYPYEIRKQTVVLIYINMLNTNILLKALMSPFFNFIGGVKQKNHNMLK